MEYSNIKNFNDLCWYGSLYVSNQVKKSPNWIDLEDGKKALYEMVGKHEWIGKIIYSYNLLGFYTYCSQPGRIYQTKLFANHYDAMTEQNNPNYKYLRGNYEMYQRACVNGFMEKDKAIKLYELVNQNPNYIISLSCMENKIDKEFEVCTLPAKNRKLMCNELFEMEKQLLQINASNKQSFNDDKIFKKIPDIPVTYYGGKKEKFSNKFKILHEKYLTSMDKYFFQDDVIVSVSIMDKRWNNNEEFWNDILMWLYRLK